MTVQIVDSLLPVENHFNEHGWPVHTEISYEDEEPSMSELLDALQRYTDGLTALVFERNEEGEAGADKTVAAMGKVIGKLRESLRV